MTTRRKKREIRLKTNIVFVYVRSEPLLIKRLIQEEIYRYIMWHNYYRIPNIMPHFFFHSLLYFCFWFFLFLFRQINKVWMGNGNNVHKTTRGVSHGSFVSSFSETEVSIVFVVKKPKHSDANCFRKYEHGRDGLRWSSKHCHCLRKNFGSRAISERFNNKSFDFVRRVYAVYLNDNWGSYPRNKRLGMTNNFCSIKNSWIAVLSWMSLFPSHLDDVSN